MDLPLDTFVSGFVEDSVGTSSETMFTRRAEGVINTVIADGLNVIDAPGTI